MPDIVGTMKARAPYAFFGVGIIWLVIGAVAGSTLVLWPVVAFSVSGYLLRAMPTRRFTWAWVVSSAVLGFLLSAYQVYAWSPFIGGAFSTLALASLVGFAVFAVAHVLLFYIGLRPGTPAAPATA